MKTQAETKDKQIDNCCLMPSQPRRSYQGEETKEGKTERKRMRKKETRTEEKEEKN